MSQTRERRMYLMWRAEKRRHDYRHGEQHSPFMRVAMRFGLPIRDVKAVIAAERPVRRPGQHGRRVMGAPWVFVDGWCAGVFTAATAYLLGAYRTQRRNRRTPPTT